MLHATLPCSLPPFSCPPRCLNYSVSQRLSLFLICLYAHASCLQHPLLTYFIFIFSACSITPTPPFPKTPQSLFLCLYFSFRYLSLYSYFQLQRGPLIHFILIHSAYNIPLHTNDAPITLSLSISLLFSHTSSSHFPFAYSLSPFPFTLPLFLTVIFPQFMPLVVYCTPSSSQVFILCPSFFLFVTSFPAPISVLSPTFLKPHIAHYSNCNTFSLISFHSSLISRC